MGASSDTAATVGVRPDPLPAAATPRPGGLPGPLADVLDVAAGKAHRADPALPRTGGPAGNARLTAWLGLTLLALFLAELVTLVDVGRLVTWHIVIGLLLVPPSLAKTATTGWRMIRYYSGQAAYREAGPPVLLLRLLGPLVVLGTLAVLGTGTAVALVGTPSAQQPFVTVVGQGISLLTLHQAGFVVWAAATGLHVLARLVPARLLLARAPEVAGGGARVLVLTASLAAAAVLAVLVLGLAGSWTHGGGARSDDRGHGDRHSAERH